MARKSRADFSGAEYDAKGGYIFYNNLGKYPYGAPNAVTKHWAKVRTNANKAFTAAKVKYKKPGITDHISFLASLAAKEREKEAFVLATYAKDISSVDYFKQMPPKDYLKLINNIFNLAESFESVVQNILLGQKEQKEIEEKEDYDPNKYHGTSLRNINTNFTKNILDNFSKIIFDNTRLLFSLMSDLVTKRSSEAEITKKLNKFLEKKLDEAFEVSLKKAKEELKRYDDGVKKDPTKEDSVKRKAKEDRVLEYEAFLKIYNKRTSFAKTYGPQVFKDLGLDKLASMAVESIKALENDKSRANFEKELEATLESSKDLVISSKKAGLIEEYMRADRGKFIKGLEKAVTIKNKNLSFTGRALKSVVTGRRAHTRPDVMRFDQSLAGIFKKTIGDKPGSNAKAVVKQFEDFAKKAAIKKPDSIIIYENIKNYGVDTDNFNEKGFGGSERNLNQIKHILDKVGVNNSNLYINKIKQLRTGAIYDSDAGVLGQITQDLASALAYFLFDDFYTIGDIPKGTRGTIHLFSLSRTVFPLSLFLEKTIEVLSKIESLVDTPQEAAGVIKIDISQKAVIYDYNTRISKKLSGESSEMRWENQRARASNDASIVINFWRDFKNIILSLYE